MSYNITEFDVTEWYRLKLKAYKLFQKIIKLN